MTFLELRNLVLYYLDDLQAGYFTATQVNRWLNNAQESVQKKIIQAFEDLFIKCVQTTCVIGQREYNLPDDFRKLNRLQLILSGTTASTESVANLSYITRGEEGSWDTNLGTPCAFYFLNKQIILSPAPDTAKTLRMDYTYRLANLSADGDISEIPVEYHELIAISAVVDGLIKDGRDPGTLLAKKAMLEDELRKDAEQRNISSPRTIVYTGGDDYTGGDIY